MAADVAMDEMQIDFSMEDEVDPEIARLQAEAAAINAQAEETMDNVMNVEDIPEEGELSSSTAVPNKIHIRGLNQLNTFDIEAWVKEHDQSDLFQKVQWIDDNSANLVFDNELAATEALAAFAVDEVMDPLQLYSAKRPATHPDADLQVRQAIIADVKAPKAKERSAFYLFNKEWDPDNPDNIRPDRKRKRYETSHRSNKYRRQDNGARVFNEDMYDDAPEPVARRHSHSSNGEHGRRGERNGEDLMNGRRSGRLRDRSASPIGDSDGRYGFDDAQPSRRTARARSFTPPGIRAGRDNRAARDNLRKELFPEKRNDTEMVLSERKQETPRAARELFPDKIGTPIHRRQDAQDLDAEEVARAIGQYTLDGTYEPGNHTYIDTGRRSEPTKNSGKRDLFSRVEGGPKVESRHGRLEDTEAQEGFNIRGAGNSNSKNSPGFNILGASRERTEHTLPKELFPVKADGGKDLFDGRIKGRGAQRRRAEDMF